MRLISVLFFTIIKLEDFFFVNGHSFSQSASKSFALDNDSAQECARKYYANATSFVCVCNATFCDVVEPVGEIPLGKVILYSSTSDKLRLKRSELTFGKNHDNHDGSDLEYDVEIRVDGKARPRQTIFGFGGAFTDAAGINFNALSGEARENLLEAYFGENGIEYTIGRVPIASCDFSTRQYSYLETPDDFELRNFSLAHEDFQYKIPHILEAQKLSGGRLKLFASPWSAPGWMKTNGQMAPTAPLRGELNGKYYRAYAKYLVRFFEEYMKHNVPFWGMTIQNEPQTCLAYSEFCKFQNLNLDSDQQRDFARHLLVPALRASLATENVKLMAHDDQRDHIFDAAQTIYNENSTSAIDGLAVHWYAKNRYEALTETHNLRPDKFILPTEACTGFEGTFRWPLLGDWGRGLEYAHDIINDLLNWAVGWTDWNLALDLDGGPNWVKNFVDSPVIVNATADEFYKQSMFYVLGHFSKFIPRGSVQVESSSSEAWDESAGTATIDGVTHALFKTPRQQFVLVVLNEAQEDRMVQIREHSKTTVFSAPPQSIHTLIWKEP